MKYLELFERHVENLKPTGSGDNYIGLCPNHNDRKPSFSCNIELGLFQCYGCTFQGNAVDFAKHFDEDPTPYYSNGYKSVKNGVNKPQNQKELTRNKHTVPQKPKISQEELERMAKEFNQRLNPDQKHLDANKVGEYENGSLTFPYFDSDGMVKGIHIHKSAPHWIGDGTNSWYNIWNIDDEVDVLYICEGEKDTLYMMSEGYHAICGSAGCKSIPEFIPNQILTAKEIRVIYDNDKGGRVGDRKIASHLASLTDSPIYLIRWDYDLPKGFDICDSKLGEEFQKAINKKERILRKVGVFTVMNERQMSELTVPKREWIIEDILPEKSNTIIAGTTGSKKSYWAMQLGMSVANGERYFMESKIAKPLKVLYVDTEIGYDAVVQRFQDLKKSLNWKNLGNWMCLSKVGSVQDVFKDLHKFIEDEFRPDFLIIDSLYNSTSANDFSKADKMAGVTNQLTEFKDRYGCSMLTVGHFNKYGTELGLVLDRMAGSSVLQNWLEYALIMVKTNVPNLNLFKIGKTRHTYHDETVLGLEFKDNLWFEKKGIISDFAHLLQPKAKMDKYDSILDDLDDTFDTNGWLNVCKVKHPNVSERTYKTWLNEVQNTPRVYKVSHGLYKKGLNKIDNDIE